MNNICAVCGRPFIDDKSSTAVPELCKGHSAPVSDVWKSEILTSDQPDYTEVLENIFDALKHIAQSLCDIRDNL